MTQSTTNNLVEKLLGRENYDFWKVTARSYLTIKGYWKCITEENSSTDAKDVLLYEKALAELFLMKISFFACRKNNGENCMGCIGKCFFG